MSVEYARNVLNDLRDIAAYYVGSDNPDAAAKVVTRIQEVVARLARAPHSGRPLIGRPGIRVVPLRHYRYNIFYSVTGETIRILHIRHTSRRPWNGA